MKTLKLVLGTLVCILLILIVCLKIYTEVFTGYEGCWKSERHDEWVAITRLPSDVTKILTDSFSEFHPVGKVVDLPQEVLYLITGPDGKMAEPGQRWERGCVNRRSLPTRRLVWAVTNGKYFVIHYESGGVSCSERYLVAIAQDKTVRSFWRGSSLGKMDNFQVFLKSLSLGAMDD